MRILIALFLLLSLKSVKSEFFSIDLEQAPQFISSSSNFNNKLKWQGAVDVSSNNSVVVFLYAGAMGIGTPAQTFTMYFDSGSDLTWVRSDTCIQVPECIGHDLYKSSLSSTYQKPPNIVMSKIPYVDGTVISGNLVTDVMSTAGSTVLSSFIAVNEISGSPKEDGILGLSLKSSFLTAVLESSSLTSAIFSFYIEAKDSRGSLTLGAINTARLTDPLQWIPLTEADGVSPATGFWSANMVSASVGATTAYPGGAQYVVSSPGMSTVFDTGSSLAILQSALTDQIHSTLPHTKEVDASGQSRYLLKNCSGLPNITLSFASPSGTPINMVFTSDEYTYLQGNPGVCISGIVGASTTQVSNLKNVGAIIGNVLLRRYVSVFDLGNLRYGFSVAKRASGIVPILSTDGIISDPAQALKNAKASSSVRQLAQCSLLVFVFGIALIWMI